MYSGCRGLIDRRHLRRFVIVIEGTAAQQVEHLESPHKAIAIEVGLELAIVTAWCQITHSHHLGTQSVVCNSIKHSSLCQELGTDITVVEELAEPQLTLVEHRHSFTLVMDDPYLAHGGRGLLSMP